MVLDDFFKDLTVVELAGVLAGPAVGMFFAELGARVIKIEPPASGGDMTRHWKLPSESPHSAYSAYYASVNWRKEVLLKDLAQSADNSEVRQLIASADIVISNFRPSSAKAFGMDPDTLLQRHPGLIYAQILAFPDDESRPGFDIVLQAEAGYLYMNGEPNGESVKMPVALIDIIAAHQLKEAILMALLHRYKTGKGAHISVSLLEAALASLANQASNWLMAGHIPQKMGSCHPNIAPYGDIFYTKDDKPLVLAVGTSRQFRNLCICLGMPSLADEPQYRDNTDRVSHRQALRNRLQPLFLQWDRELVMSRLLEYGVPAGSILDMQEVFQSPVARQMILEEYYPDGTLSKRVKTVAFQSH